MLQAHVIAAALAALLLIAARDVNGADVSMHIDSEGDLRIGGRAASESHKCDDGVLAYLSGGEKVATAITLLL